MVGSTETAYLAGGCFWCTEAVYLEIEGVKSVDSGYSGGHVESPTYEQVCTGTTGHAETVKVAYDPDIISYRDILEIFFSTHDPTTPNRQGYDVGPQYRSAVFYLNEGQKKTAEAMIRELNASGKFKAPIVTEVTEFTNFYTSEDYHKEYFKRNQRAQYCQFVIKPKMEKLRKEHTAILRR